MATDGLVDVDWLGDHQRRHHDPDDPEDPPACQRREPLGDAAGLDHHCEGEEKTGEEETRGGGAESADVDEMGFADEVGQLK